MDDKVQFHSNNLKYVLSFSDSPVNILSETELAKSMKYDVGTHVLTKRHYYFFTSDFLKCTNTI